MLVGLEDFVQLECAPAEGGEVFPAQGAEQHIRVMRQRIGAVDEFLPERRVARLRAVKRGGENQPAAVTVLAVALVALHRQTHQDEMQHGQLVVSDVLRAEVLFVFGLYRRAAEGEAQRQRHRQNRRQLHALFKQRRNQAGNRRDHRGEAELRAEKRAQREQQGVTRPRPQAFRVPRLEIGEEDHRRKREGEHVGV